jgi:ABC-type multidrug transport system fused ATPase/permease subunit
LSTVSPLWLRHADRVVLLADGQAVASGTHAELMALRGKYYELTIAQTEE